MADIVAGQEQIFDIPAHLVKRKYGFSLDVGGSATKIAYSLPFEDKVRFHLISYPRERTEEGLQYLEEKIGGQVEPQAIMYTCGIGCNIYLERLQKTFHVRIHNLMETNCQVDAFQFLQKNLPLEDIVFPESQTVKEYSLKIRDCLAKMQYSLATTYKEQCRGKMWKSSEDHMASIHQKESGTTQPTDAATSTDAKSSQKVEYPIILVCIGSATSPQKVEENGNYLCVDIMPTGGKTLLALGGLLAGAKTYEELVALAERGSAEHMDILGKHLPLDDDVYSLFKTDFTTFAMGHAVGKSIGDFSREDLAAGACSLVAQNVAMCVQHWAMTTRVKQVFFIGGLANSHYMREQLGKFFAYRSKANALGIETEHYFVKLGSYLGALGGLLTTLNA